jgi:putative transposase
MKRSKFTEQQIVFALKQAETGVSVAEVCRKLGISEATFYNWKKKYEGLGAAELRRLRQLEEENGRLKQIVADLTLDKQMLQDVLKKSSKACPKKAVGKRFVGWLPGIEAKGLLGRDAVAYGVSLHRTQTRRSGGQAADEGDS